MLTIVLWKWRKPGYHRTFTAEHVNAVKRMIDRHYTDPHRVVLVTDDPEGVDPDIRCIPIWDDYAEIPNPCRPNMPSCYRRLKIFARDAAEVFGERILSLDLDCVLVDDMRPLWNRPEDFVIWEDPSPRQPYNGGMFLLTAGSQPHVWEDFDPETSIKAAFKKGYRGSDQAWFAYALPKAATWKRGSGIISFKQNMKSRGLKVPPEGTRVVMFHGQFSPWDKAVQDEYPWVRQAWNPPSKPKTCLVLGGAGCLKSDIDAALDVGEFDGVFACNDAGAWWPGQLDGLVTLHPEKLPEWLRKREKARYPAPKEVISHKAHKSVTTVTEYRWPDIRKSGSSGLFAARIPIERGFDRVVLCGIPLVADQGHFFDRSEWTAARNYRAAWEQAAKPYLSAYVRSMSGWTRDLLGAPSSDWLTA